MFDITDNKGFRITFANGWTASVQWGAGNYCDGYCLPLPKGFKNGDKAPASADAEVWAWKGDLDAGETLGDVRGYLSPAEVLAYLNEVASL